jgi:hypothetical protein
MDPPGEEFHPANRDGAKEVKPDLPELDPPETEPP